MPPDPKNLYERAGILDVAEFYRTRYISDELLDARYFDWVNRFDIRWSRTMWVYANVRRGARVLDLGCGGGVLALLKRKDVELIGVDLSAQCAEVSRRNGYDATYVAQLEALPFADATFDYVVSLDVLGHIAFEDKDAVLAEIKRVLRPAGVTLHGIEIINREKRKGYDEMSEEELKRYISVDGHIGMEEETATAERFKQFFTHVQIKPRYAICASSDEFLKQADDYGMPPADTDFLDYLRRLSFNERRAFNMAMGYVFGRISDYNIAMPKAEYAFLKASSAPLGDFYNEHRDEEDSFALPQEADKATSICLDRSPRAAFDAGWYEANSLPPVARWMGKRASIRFAAASLARVRLDLTSHIPDLQTRPLELEFFLNDQPAHSLSLVRQGWLELEIDVAEIAARQINDGAGCRIFQLEIRADRTWQPRPNDAHNRDDRQLSIAVCNIEILP